MNTRQGWWELAQVVTELGFASRNEAKRAFDRCRRQGLIDREEFSAGGLTRVASHTRVKNRQREASLVSELGTSSIADGGRPRELLFLSPVAVSIMAAQTNTHEAKAWVRRIARERAETDVLALATIPSTALSVSSETSATVLSGLIARVEQLEHRLTPVETRVEKLETRGSKQLRLPMALEVDDVAKHATVIATLEKLIAAVNGPSGARGLLAREIFELIASGHVAALELQEAIKAINGNRMPATAVVLGKVLQRVSATDGALEGQWVHGHVRRWIVTSDGVH